MAACMAVWDSALEHALLPVQAAAVEDVVAHVHTLVRTPVKAVAWEAATQDVAA